jgi:uncharacterized membrane protein
MRSSRLWSPGSSLGFVVLVGIATIVILTDGVINPDRLGFSLGFFALGLFGTWRRYLRWRQPKGAATPRPAASQRRTGN